MAKVQDEASQITRENGFVIVDGPNGVAVTLTPEAALETSKRLQKIGVEAQAERGSGAAEPNPDE